ncbi:probable serine/threonine-protein kinase SMG1 at C-terminar half [Coccomyxa sp. Obi]|nr:probable serine/threonine-protein kinase SMG1 at C-terminar half [Coccomyxa sp. Obi]
MDRRLDQTQHQPVRCLMDSHGGRGRGGRARGRRKQLPLEQPDTPTVHAQKNPLQSLVRTAVTPSNNAARRVAALKDLHKMLRDGDTDAVSTVQGSLPSLWPQILGVSSGLLFNWALPLLSAQQGRDDSGQGADVGSMFWVMTALREGLQHCDDKTVARHIHSLRAHFKDLVDLLLGWSLEPTLPDSTRPLLYSTFMSFQPIWCEQQSFAAGLLNNLISDVERLTGGQDSAITLDNLKQLLALSSCVTAIIQACGPETLPIQDLLQKLARAMQSAIPVYHGLFHSPSGIPSATEEICHFLRTVLMVALPEKPLPQQLAKQSEAGQLENAEGQTSTAPEEDMRQRQPYFARTAEHLRDGMRMKSAQAKDSSPSPAIDQTAADLDDQQHSLVATESCQSSEPLAQSEAGRPTVAASCMALLGVVDRVLQGVGQWAESADLLAALHLSLAVLDVLWSSPSTGIPAETLDLLLGLESFFPKLRSHSDMAVTKLVTHIYFRLLQHPSRSTRQAAVHLILADLRAQLSAATQEGASEAAASLARFSVSLLSQDALNRQFAAAIWAGLYKACAPTGAVHRRPLLWVEVLRLLQKVSAPRSHDFLSCGAADTQVVPFWLSLATSAREPSVRLLAAEWLVASAVAVSQQDRPSRLDSNHSVAAVGEGDGSLVQSMQQLHVSGKERLSSDEEKEVGSALRMPARSFHAAAVSAVLSLAEAADESLRTQAANMARRLLGLANSKISSAIPEPVAATDAHLVQTFADVPMESDFSEEEVIRLGQAVCERLSDVSAAVAAHWRGLLSELEPHLARIATGIGTYDLSYLPALQHAQPNWRAELALQPQRQLLQPQQLTRLLDWLSQASPAILTRPQGAPTILTRPNAASEPAPTRKETDMMEWLVQLPGACAALDESHPPVGRRVLANVLQLACVHTMEVQLRRLLHLKRDFRPGAAIQLQSTWLFLDFMMALERQIQAACEGSCSLPLPPPSALSFFTVAKNRKAKLAAAVFRTDFCRMQACEEWFARMRSLQLRLAVAAGQNGATIFHACLQLLQLQRQAAALLAPAAPDPQPAASAPAAAHPSPADITTDSAAHSAATSAATPVAPLGQSEWPSLGASAAPAKPSSQEKRRSKLAAKLDRKKQGGRKAMPLPVQPRILQRSEEAAAPSAKPQPARRSAAAPTQAGARMAAPKTAPSAAAPDLMPRLEKLSREVLSTLRHACTAFCAQGDPDAIAGLHNHALQTFGALFLATRVQPGALCWMEGMRLDAAGSYEAAARLYVEALRSAGATMAPEGVSFLSNRAAAAYVAIADWSGLEDVSSITASMRALAALDHGDTKKALELFQSWSHGDAKSFVPSPGTARASPRAADNLPAGTAPAAASGGLSDSILLKALTAFQAANSTGTAQLEAPTDAAVSSAASDQAAADRTGVRILSRDRRRGQDKAQLSSLQEVTPGQQELPKPSSSLTAALEEVRADQQRLTAQLAIVSCEGMPTCAPLLTDSWVASLLCRSLEAHMQGASQQELLCQLSTQVTGAAAGRGLHVPALSNGLLGAVGSGSAEISRLGTGGRSVEVRPWVQAEQILRIAGADGGRGASEAPELTALLLDIAAAARRSGNAGFAARLLDRVVSRQTAGNSGVDAEPAEQSNRSEFLLRSQMERFLLQAEAHSPGSAGQAKALSEQAAMLWHILAAEGTDQGAIKGRSLRAEAYLRLASWSCTLPAPTLAGLSKRALDSCHEDTMDTKGSPAELGPAEHAFPAECFKAAALAAPEGSSISAKAWASYADWLFAQHAQFGDVRGWSGLKGASPPAGQGSNGQAASDDRAADDQTEAATREAHTVELEALQAYCTSLESDGLSVGQSGSPEDHVAALLRVLQVQADLMSVTQDTDNAIKKAVARVPMRLWHAVTPQLFTYLEHAKEAVRAFVAEILKSLQVLLPSAVIYPALASLARKGGPVAEAHQVLEAFREQQPEALDGARMFVEELARVASLWNEQWMHTLQEVQAEVERRCGALQLEAAHMQAMHSPRDDLHDRMTKRYAIMVAPALLLLEQTAAATISRRPETPHEREFHAEFSAPLKEAIAAFHSAVPTNIDAGSRPAAAVLEPLQALASKIERRCRATQVKLADVSPRLAALSASAIPVPAQEMAALPVAQDALPTLVGVDDRIEILGTKTRPKRLWLRGSNGARYSFLLKGREELRLDERLMQLLRFSNAVLRGSEVSVLRQLQVRTFGVTPLGPRTGLIEWVEHSVPLFGLYQNSLGHSMAAAAATAIETPNAAPQPVLEGAAPVMKLPTPTEAFFNRLIPALKASGIDPQAPRKEWPRELLRQVVTELMRDAPRGMLAREILAGAAGPADWCARQQAHARSSAVMSVIGWLLGLGDRHLDNILFDKRTAELVHIDYNVVFERGKQLRVPEIVPFRLTQSMQSALGVTGVEGAFRLGAESALAALRASEGALSTVLLSTLNAPSVELSSGHHMSAMHKEADLVVTLRLISLRIGEVGPQLFPQLSVLGQALRAAGDTLQQWSPLFQSAAAALQAAEDAHQQAVSLQAALTGAEARREGALERLTGAHAAESQMRHDISGLRSAMEQGLRECRGWAERHAYTVQKLRSSALQELSLPTEYWLSSASRAPLGLVSAVGSPTSKGVVSLALRSGARPPPDLLGLCAAVDEKAAALLSARDQSLLAATAALQEYAAALQQVLPPDYVATSHHAKWGDCFMRALGACDRSLGVGMPSPAGIEEEFFEAWQQAPADTPPQDAIRGYRALHVAAEATLSARAASEGEMTDLMEKASGSLQHAEEARSALLELLQQEKPAAWRSAVAAFAVKQQEHLYWIQNQAPQHRLEHLQQLILGLAEVAKLLGKAAGHAFPKQLTFLGDESTLHAMTGGINDALRAQASFNLLTLPALLGCAMAGPTGAVLKDAGAVLKVRQEVDSILHEAHQLMSQHGVGLPSGAVEAEQGVEQGAASQLSGIEGHAVADLMGALQHRATACVDSFGAIMVVGDHTVHSTILPALGRLYASLQGLFKDGGIDCKVKDGLCEVKGWEACAFTARLMDDLLRACFEQPGPPAAQPVPSSSSQSQPQSHPAAEDHSAVQTRLQGILAAALGQHILQFTTAVLARMQREAADAPLPDDNGNLPLLSKAGKGLESDAALLEANPVLESADQELDRLEQEGPGSDAELADDLDWLDEAAIEQQQHTEASGTAGLEEWTGQLQRSNHEAAGMHGGEPLEPQLQPFLDFDEEAGGAEGPLEAGIDEDVRLRHPSELEQELGAGAMPGLELQPFAGFDHGLVGADEALETEITSSESSDSGAYSSSQHSAADLEHDIYSAEETGDKSVAPVTSLLRHTSAAAQDLTAEGSRCVDFMTACSEASGAHALMELQHAAVLAALQQAEGQVAMNAAALALYEWTHESDLAAAGLLGAPIEVAPQGQQGWTLRNRRSQLLGALDASLRNLAGLEEALAAWAGPASATEAALQAAVAPPGKAEMGVAERLSHFLELRRQWLSIAGDQAAAVMRLGQAVLQLELSREGKAWAGASGMVGGCEAYKPLMQQLQLLCTACVAAVNEAQTARDELASLSAELAATAPALEAAVCAEHEASTAFGSLAAPVLAQSAAAQKACKGALSVLERFPLRRLDFIVHDLKHLAGREVPVEEVVRGLAREALERHRCIAAAWPGLPTALLPLLHAFQQSALDEPRSEEPSNTTRQAAILVAAALPHAAAAHAQVAVAEEAAAAAERLQAVLSSVAEMAMEAVHARQQPAATEASHADTTSAHAGTLRADGGRGAARVTQAAAIYQRFLEKLQGGSGRSSEQRAHGRGDKPDVRAGEGLQEGNIEQPLLGVSEQVSVLVKEATSLENLAQMYEGWSAWI